MVYIINNDTGRKYYVNPIRECLLKISYPVSYLCYGFSIAILFDLLGFQSETVISLLVAAYAIEFILDLFDKTTPILIIFIGFMFIILLPIWIDIYRSENMSLFKMNFTRIHHIIDLYHNIGRNKMKNLSCLKASN